MKKLEKIVEEMINRQIDKCKGEECIFCMGCDFDFICAEKDKPMTAAEIIAELNEEVE